MKKRFEPRKFLNAHRQGLFVLTIGLVAIYSIGFGYRLHHRNDEVILGVSFSVKAAEELGLDWMRTYLALLDDIEVKNVRLMSYWDEHEPEPGVYDFSDLDWQIDQAQRHDVDVSLAVGRRQPRWPECHVPEWAKPLSQEEQDELVLDYVARVVDRYKDSPAVVSYQVENEAANEVFGDCPPYDSGLLAREIALVKQIDPEATVITNAGDQIGFITKGPVKTADSVGFSMYNNAYTEVFGQSLGYRFLLPADWHSLRAGLVSGVLNKPVFVHELQTEPWGVRATVDLTLEEQNRSMDVNRIRSQVDYAKRSGIKEMYLWGGEWWYWRLTEFDDKELWDTIREIYAS